VSAFLLAALGLRLLLLGSKSLWLDEALSLRIALSGQAALWSGTVEIGHPILVETVPNRPDVNAGSSADLEYL